MKSAHLPSSTFADSKSHYEILDGLRGVAALTVVIFHVFEIFSMGDHTKMLLNHAYLAVDFFFLLSGFVIGHAYDDRWDKMSLQDFFKRRLIRLHPMILVGMAIGAICFYWSASEILFPPISSTPLWKLVLLTLLGFALIPVPISLDIRGWNEMYPLNGPAWTLFFEYIANIFYALFLRRISTRILSVLVFVAGVILLDFALTNPNGDMVGGWSLTQAELKVGFIRLSYPFLAGLLLVRIFKPKKIKNAFLWCSLLLIFVLVFPRVGDKENLWMNGIYDASTIILIFPIIVFLGASGEVKSTFTAKICRFLGEISYPIYIIHYPLIYIFSAWVINHKVALQDAWPVGLPVFFGSIILAYACVKFYDIPLRKYLTKRWMNKS